MSDSHKGYEIKYIVSANGHVFGIYDAEDEQDARNLCCLDAGYYSEEDMVSRLERPSDLIVEIYSLTKKHQQ